MSSEAWTGFFAAQVGATAALAGLVIVAISINIARILSFPQLPGRAAETLVMLAGALLICSLMMFPPGAIWVSSCFIVACVSWALTIALQIRDLSRRERELPYRMIARVGLCQLSLLPMLAGGWLVAANDAAGLTWLALSVLAALVAAMINTWVLLVEILR